MAKRTLYDVLGVAPDAGEEDIKRAYKTLARKYHPDLNQGNPNAEMAFKAVSQANDVLGDPGRRAQYDSALEQESGKQSRRGVHDRDTDTGGRKRIDLIFVAFAACLIFAVIFFFKDTPKGIYFLVVAIALEIKTSIEALRTDLRRKP